jgi:putative DNA primase/helicase
MQSNKRRKSKKNNRNGKLAHARYYARSRGWPVFPVHFINDGECSCGRGDECHSPGKHPMTANGFKDASTDLDQIEEWWGEHPEANIGVATGNGLTVLDIDPDHGGDKSLARLKERFGDLPETLNVNTGGGGTHDYFDDGGQELRNRANLAGLPGIDVRGAGGYIVAPPSNHLSGGKYKFESGPKGVELAPCPMWLADLIMSRKKFDAAGKPDSSEESPSDGSISEGSRNDTLTSLAGSMRRRDMSKDSITSALLKENQRRCSPPLEDDEVYQIVESVCSYDPSTLEDGPSLTDLGNAERLIELHGDELRYVPEVGWCAWDGCRWQRKGTSEVYRRAASMLRKLKRDAESIPDSGDRDRMMKHALRSQDARRITAMINLAKHSPSVSAGVEDFDADPWLFNCLNGTVDLRTGELRAHERNDLITNLAPVEYDPDAEAPRWKRFIEEITGGDERLADFLARAAGYALTGDSSEQVLIYLYGTGANGKSTFLAILQDMMGDYARQADPELLIGGIGRSHPTGLASLVGARFVVCTEVDRGRRMAEVVVKMLTGGDKVAARFMRQDFFEFEPSFKLFVGANYKLMTQGTDHALWRRILLVPMDVRIDDESRDRHLREKLAAELDGILAWAVRGCLQWQERGLEPPKPVRQASEAYRSEMDVFKAFTDELCAIDIDASCATADLYAAYVSYCRASNEEADSQRMFTSRLKEAGFTPHKGSRGKRMWKGITLRCEPQEA